MLVETGLDWGKTRDHTGPRKLVSLQSSKTPLDLEGGKKGEKEEDDEVWGTS